MTSETIPWNGIGRAGDAAIAGEADSAGVGDAPAAAFFLPAADNPIGATTNAATHAAATNGDVFFIFDCFWLGICTEPAQWSDVRCISFQSVYQIHLSDAIVFRWMQNLRRICRSRSASVGERYRTLRKGDSLGPQIRLAGRWLADAGFKIGDRLVIEVSHHELCITRLAPL